jgi:hypothetical protein
MEEVKNAHRILVGKPEEKKRPLGRPKRRREDKIRMVIMEKWGGVDWVRLVQWLAFVNTVMNLRFCD